MNVFPSLLREGSQIISNFTNYLKSLESKHMLKDKLNWGLTEHVQNLNFKL